MLVSVVSEKTVSKITQEESIAASTSKNNVTPEKSRPPPKKINLDDFDLSAIRQQKFKFYIVKKPLPTLLKLRVALREDVNFQESITTLYIILHSIGSQYKRYQSKRKLLMEHYDITAQHAKYIEKINQIVEKWFSYMKRILKIHAKSRWQTKEEPGVSISESENGFINDALSIFKSQSKSSDYDDFN